MEKDNNNDQNKKFREQTIMNSCSIFMPGGYKLSFTAPCSRATLLGKGVFSSPTLITQTGCKDQFASSRNGMPPLAPGYSACTIADELVLDGIKNLIQYQYGLDPRAQAYA